MKKINKIRKLFVRQQASDDCGLACLAMIFRYCGKQLNFLQLWQRVGYNGEALSLLDLKNIAAKFNIAATCVEMDMDFLAQNDIPCILLMKTETGEDHFQVCFGASHQQEPAAVYLMADPAHRVYYLPGEMLAEQWVSRSALYFENLTEISIADKQNLLTKLFRLSLLPAGLWLLFPVLNLFTALLGVALTWFLERGVNNSLEGDRETLLAGTLILLLVITLSKNLFSFLKERLLINMNKKMSKQLYSRLFDVLQKTASHRKISGQKMPVDRNIADIQKIQNALSILMAVLISEGFLIIMSLSGIIYLNAWAALFSLIYGFTILLITVVRLPKMSIEQEKLNALAGGIERYLKDGSAKGISLVDRYRTAAYELALKLNRNTFYFESFATVCVLSALLFCETQLRNNGIDYACLIVTVVLTYLITGMFQKVCNAFYVFMEGMEAFRYSNLI